MDILHLQFNHKKKTPTKTSLWYGHKSQLSLSPFKQRLVSLRIHLMQKGELPRRENYYSTCIPF